MLNFSYVWSRLARGYRDRHILQAGWKSSRQKTPAQIPGQTDFQYLLGAFPLQINSTKFVPWTKKIFASFALNYEKKNGVSFYVEAVLLWAFCNFVKPSTTLLSLLQLKNANL